MKPVLLFELMLESVIGESVVSQNLYIESLLQDYDSIGLSDLNEHNLQRRIDSKYVFSYQVLIELLNRLSNEFYVLEVNNKRLQTYNNIYFDTPDFKLYNKHHNGHKNRYKVRKRHYKDSNISFLEVKHKDNKSVTTKTRIKVPNSRANIKSFIYENLPKEYTKLVPSLKNQYKRIALISKQDIVRLTLDIDLGFSTAEAKTLRPINGLAIAELKRDSSAKSESFDALLHQINLRTSSFSKYCIGTSLNHPELKYNRFKPIITQIRKFS
ncbi:MAG TPA: polyphosphate polymerase domain-containing protein [Trueperaceae bacterium]|nr:polyphosphate polymerase domain-containing protein [Trueperaceae bacterium]